MTRYDASRRRALFARPPIAARAWTVTSVCLAVAGLAIALWHPGTTPTTRLDVPTAAVTVPTAMPDHPTAFPSVLPPAPPARVRIPALGTTSEVMRLGLTSDGSLEVPPGAYPAGWYEQGPSPGELGPAVLAGHVDWEGRPGVFAGLHELLPGDDVLVDRADGTVATFRVDRVEQHDKSDFPTDAVYGDLDHAGLRLITCGGWFDQATGDYSDNVIVYARLATTG